MRTVLTEAERARFLGYLDDLSEKALDLATENAGKPDFGRYRTQAEAALTVARLLKSNLSATPQ
jgi:hypothetical protein